MTAMIRASFPEVTNIFMAIKRLVDLQEGGHEASIRKNPLYKLNAAYDKLTKLKKAEKVWGKEYREHFMKSYPWFFDEQIMEYVWTRDLDLFLIGYELMKDKNYLPDRRIKTNQTIYG